VRLLLDTHYLIWLATDRTKLTEAEYDLIEHPDTMLSASVVSIWELRTKWNTIDRNGDRKGTISPETGLALLERAAIDLTMLTAQDAIASLEPRPSNKDPFDEMLLVHAQRLGAKLLTRDRQLLTHPLAYQP
jgi:PIN domain nuclease of toxin-antitoxin system